MRWDDERYVRLYTRDTVTWKLLPWQSKCLLPQILRKLDRAGVVELGEDGLAGLAALVEMPPSLVEEGMPELLRRKIFVMNGTTLVMPNFRKAQEARQSDAQRKRDERERERVREPELETPSVTNGHQTSVGYNPLSPTVTPSLAVPSLANPPSPPEPTGEPSGVDDDPDGSKTPIPANVIAVTAASEAFRLQRGFIRSCESGWIEAYKSAVERSRPGGAFGFSKKRLADLVTVIETFCCGDDRKDIDAWIGREVEAFVRAVRKAEKPPDHWLRFDPDGLLEWENKQCPGRQKPALARPLDPPKRTDAESPATPEQAAENAKRLQELLAGGSLGQTA